MSRLPSGRARAGRTVGTGPALREFTLGISSLGTSNPTAAPPTSSGPPPSLYSDRGQDSTSAQLGQSSPSDSRCDQRYGRGRYSIKPDPERANEVLNEASAAFVGGLDRARTTRSR